MVDELWKPVWTGEQLQIGLGLPHSWGEIPDELLVRLPEVLGRDVASISTGGEPVRLVEGQMPGLPQVYIKVQRLKPAFADVLAAAAAALLPGREVDVAIAILVKLKGVLQLLSEDEAEVVRTLIADAKRMRPSINPYRSPYPLERLSASFEGGSIDLESVLDALVRKGVVAVSEGGVQLRY